MHESAPRPLRLRRDKRTLPGNGERPANAENIHEYDCRPGHTDPQRPRDDVRIDALHSFDVNHDTHSHAEYDHEFTLHHDGYDDHAYDVSVTHDFDSEGYDDLPADVYSDDVDSDDLGTNGHHLDDHAHNGNDADDHLDHHPTFDDGHYDDIVNDDGQYDDGDDCHYDTYNGNDADDHLDHHPTFDDLDDGDDYHYDDYNCRWW